MKKCLSVLCALILLPTIASAETYTTTVKQSLGKINASKNLYTEQQLDWGMKHTQIDKLWNQGYTGKNIKVAILDTGVDYEHPDLKSNVAGGVSFVPGEKDFYDYNGHGTHVAGIIAAENNGIGTVGLAYNTKLYAVKVISNDGTGELADLVKGINWAIKKKVDIINMSLAMTADEKSSKHFKPLETAINKAYKNGILVVASAGNEGKKGVSYPANFKSVIAVSASYEKEWDKPNDYRLYTKWASFSSYGGKVEANTPGAWILSTYPTKLEPFWSDYTGYEYLSGTSMAAPYLTGFLAVLKQKYPSYSAQKLRMIVLRENLLERGIPGKDNYYGYGAIVVR